MKILLIEAGYIDKDWLQDYFSEYEPGIEVLSAKSFAEAEIVLKNGNVPDIILVDGRIPDALSPTSVSGIVYNAPYVPIVFLVTGKTLHYECTRTPQAYVYHLKTDVTKVTFLDHLKAIVAEVQREKAIDGRV